MGAEVFHHLKKSLHDRGHGHGVGDEGGFAPNLDVQRGGAARRSSQGIEAAGYTPGEDLAIALDPATSELYEERPLRPRARGPRRCPPTRWPATGPTSAARYPILSIEDGMDEEDWDGWKRAHASARRPRPARRRRPVRHQHRAPEARHRARRRQLDPHQGQPDRHADGDARRRSTWRARPATPRSCRTARARPRTRRSPTSRSRPAAGRSRPARRRARTASRSTTSCCASRRRSAATPSSRGAVVFRG